MKLSIPTTDDIGLYLYQVATYIAVAIAYVYTCGYVTGNFTFTLIRDAYQLWLTCVNMKSHYLVVSGMSLPPTLKLQHGLR